MTDILKTIFTEEEAINITIEHGYNGAEFETKAWLQNGSLKTDRTQKGLISKLQTIYNNVSIEGKGKKRKYILTDKKDQISEREYNYKGTLPTEQDEIMKEYIFNKLLNYNHNKYTYKGWADTLQFINADKFEPEQMIKEIKYIHMGFPLIYNPKEVVSIFIQTLGIRNKDIIEKTFQRLQKENRINVKEIFTFQYTSKEYENVTIEEYEEVIQHLKIFLEEKGITYYIYSQSVTSIHKSNKMKEIIEQVKDYLMEEFDIIKFFKRFEVEILDNAKIETISKEQFDKAYFERFIKLSRERQQKDSYKTSLSFWKRFYLYNTLVLLEYIGLENINELVREEYLSYKNEIDNYYLDVIMSMEERRNTFGGIKQINYYT